MGLPKQQEPIPIDWAASIMFSPKSPQSICDNSYDGSLAMNTTVRSVSEHVLEIRIVGYSVLILFLKYFCNSVDIFGIIYHAYSPRLFIHAVGRIDTTFNNGLHSVSAHSLRLILTDAASRHDSFYCLIFIGLRLFVGRIKLIFVLRLHMT